jgi:predicted RNase H-like nuclease (RuvC/YqgF family)
MILEKKNLHTDRINQVAAWFGTIFVTVDTTYFFNRERSSIECIRCAIVKLSAELDNKDFNETTKSCKKNLPQRRKIHKVFLSANCTNFHKPERNNNKKCDKTTKSYEKIAILHKKVTTLHEKIIILHRKVTILHEKVTMLHRKVTMLHEKVTMLHEKIIILHEKVIMLHRKITFLHKKVIFLRKKGDFLRKKVIFLYKKNIPLCETVVYQYNYYKNSIINFHKY